MVAHVRSAKGGACANVAVGVKVCNLTLNRVIDEVVTYRRTHGAKIIVLDFQRRDEKEGKVARHDTGELIVVQVQEFQASATHGSKIGRHRPTQFIVIQVDESDAAQWRRRLTPVSRNIATESIVRKIQVVKESQVPVLRNGTRQIIVVDAQVACATREKKGSE